jgi:glycosyltransferase involved in cell wall biosynthesis
MRILIANEAFAGSGGVESYLAGLMPALRARGHAVALLHANTRTEAGATRLDAAELTAGVADEGLAAALDRIRAWRPDVCFSHNMRFLEIEERLLGEWPVVKMMHGYFGTCVSGHKAHAFPSIVPCGRAFGPACLALYLPRHCGQYRPARMLRQYRRESQQHALLARYAAILTASRHMAGEFIRHRVDPARVIAAPLFATEPSPAAPREPPRVPMVMFAGRMTAIKGGAIAVRAVAAAARRIAEPVKLIMAGDGPERLRLEALALERGVDARFPGWVSGERRTSLFRASSLVVVPSLWPEPFGLVGLEAAVHGVPAVAFDAGGIGEWLRDGVNGALVRERGDAGALGAAIARLLGDTRQLARCGAGAVAVARELSIDAHVSTVERVLAEAPHTVRAAM